MKFCEKDGSLLEVRKRDKHTFLVCRKCGKKYKPKGEELTIAETLDEKKEVVVMGKEEGLAEFPITTIMCPKCENMEAHWWMQQTRAADEPPTIFYKCTKCGYTWRTYG